MPEKTTAQLLQDRLTEHGLVRVLSKQDVSPHIIKELPLEEAAWQIQRDFAPARARPAKKAARAKKARPKKSAVKKSAKKAKKSHGSSGLTVVRQPNYWRRVKKELHILLCTNEPKYASIRRNLGTEGKATQAFIASSITGAVVPFAGASAVVIGPLVTIGLIALVRVGTNAWCAGQIE